MDRRACNSLAEKLARLEQAEAQITAVYAQCLKELQEERNQHGICQQALQLEEENHQETKEALYHACILSDHIDHILNKTCAKTFDYKALEFKIEEQRETIEKLRSDLTVMKEELAGSNDHYDALAEACNLKAMRVRELEEKLSVAQTDISRLQKELKECKNETLHAS